MVGIALEPYNFAQLVAPDLGSFASGDGRERERERARRMAQVSIKLLLIIPETQRFGKVPFSLSLSRSVGRWIGGSVPPVINDRFQVLSEGDICGASWFAEGREGASASVDSRGETPISFATQ